MLFLVFAIVSLLLWLVCDVSVSVCVCALAIDTALILLVSFVSLHTMRVQMILHRVHLCIYLLKDDLNRKSISRWCTHHLEMLELANMDQYHFNVIDSNRLFRLLSTGTHFIAQHQLMPSVFL